MDLNIHLRIYFWPENCSILIMTPFSLSKSSALNIGEVYNKKESLNKVDDFQ